MKKLLPVFILFALCPSLKAQVPVMGPISGPSVVCVPGQTPIFSTSASNNASFYNWSVFPSGPTITSPMAANTQISFPNVTQNYTLLVYATNSAGNSAPVTSVVKVYQVPTVSFSGLAQFCQGSGTFLMASPTMQSSSTTLNYTWTPSTGVSNPNSGSAYFTPSSTTNYVLQIASGSCTNLAYITVTVNPNPTVTVNGNTSAICAGKSSTLTLNGGIDPYMINGVPTQSMTVISPMITTSYVITGSNAFGCTSNATFTQTVNPAPILQVSSTPAKLCQGKSAQLTISGGLDPYLVNGVNTPGTSTITPLQTTVYTIVGTNSFGCSTTALYTQSVQVCTAINEDVLVHEMIVYPNPNNGDFFIRSSRTENAVLTNQLGQQVRQLQLKQDREVLVNDLPSGIYFLVTSTTKIKLLVYK